MDNETLSARISELEQLLVSETIRFEKEKAGLQREIYKLSCRNDFLIDSRRIPNPLDCEKCEYYIKGKDK